MMCAMLTVTARSRLILLACACAASAQADDKDWLAIEGDYLVGASVVSGNGHVGDVPVKYDFKPMWAFQLGPFRVSRSRASSLIKAGRREELETGVSADFDFIKDWRLGASLRMDNGRDFGPGSRFFGLPSIPTTLRGRLSTGSAMGEHWSWSASYDKDLLGRGGGGRLSSGLNRRIPLDGQRHWDWSVGATWGDRTYLQTHYAISGESARRTGHGPYALGGGWENLRTGLQYTHVLSDHWVLFGGVELSRMVNSVARSPLVGRKTTHSISAGIAFRSTR
jgi:MipA family protein